MDITWDTFDHSEILITGGTGSLGQHLIKTLLANCKPRRLIIFSRDELKQHEMRMAGLNDDCLRWFIGDVRDLPRLQRAFKGVDIVIHTAALKQVPAIEYNPIEAVRTNIYGAVNVIEAALDCGVQKVIGLSSDKCCAPLNLYGATKLVAEKLFVQANSYRGAQGTRFSCVRYGNVLGSRGSVLDVWRKAEKSGKVTLTDATMTRFFLTLPQAVAFVLSSLEMMEGGEVFVPKLKSIEMEELVRIIAPKAGREFIGIRPGEKMHESMVSVDEAAQTVELLDRFAILPTSGLWAESQWAGLPRMPQGWSYGSLGATRFTAAEMRELLTAVG